MEAVYSSRQVSLEAITWEMSQSLLEQDTHLLEELKKTQEKTEISTRKFYFDLIMRKQSYPHLACNENLGENKYRGIFCL